MQAPILFALLAFHLRVNAFLIHPSISIKEPKMRLPAAANAPMKIISKRNLDLGWLTRSRMPQMTLRSETDQPKVFVSRNGEMDLATFPPHLQVQ